MSQNLKEKKEKRRLDHDQLRSGKNERMKKEKKKKKAQRRIKVESWTKRVFLDSKRKKKNEE